MGYRDPVKGRIWGILLALLLVWTCMDTQALAANVYPKPQWLKRLKAREFNSQSRQTLREYRGIPELEEFSDNTFVDKRTQNQLMLQYEVLMRPYEQQRNYGLRYEERHRYTSQVRSFSKYMARTVAKKKFDEGLKEAKKNSKEVATFHEVNQQVAKAAKGRLQVAMSDNVKLRTRLNIPRQTAGLHLITPVVDTSLNYYMGEDPTDLSNVLDPTRGFERYRLGMGKGIRSLGVYTGMNYGGSSTRMSAVVSKGIADGLSCEVSSTWGVDDRRAGLSGTEETVKMKYKLTF